MSNNRCWFLPFLFSSAAIIICITPIFGSENNKSNQDSYNLLWLLDDKNLKEPQAKEKRLTPEYKQILDELANSKIPTISAAEFTAKEYMKRSRCAPKDNDFIKVVELKKYGYYFPPIAIKGDLVWVVEAAIGTTTTLTEKNIHKHFPDLPPTKEESLEMLKYSYNCLYLNAITGQTFPSSGSLPFPSPKGTNWSIVRPGPLCHLKAGGPYAKSVLNQAH
jgi:hypothetical protein